MPQPSSASGAEVSVQPPPIEPESVSGPRLRAAVLKLSRRLRTIEVGSSLTPAEFSALATIVRSGQIRPSVLAQAEGLNPTMLSRMLARMTSTGVVTRGVDPRDRRAVVLRPTPEGRRTHQGLRDARARLLEAALEQLPAASRQAVLEALPGLEALADLVGQPSP
jgi:DNA-binding MarR family transcriptional regulator